MTKQLSPCEVIGKWDLQNLSRFGAPNTHIGYFNTPEEAAKRIGADFKAWVYEGNDTYVPYNYKKHKDVIRVEIATSASSAYSPYYIATTVPKLKLKSETIATLPANRDRKTVGVGEEVVIKANKPVTWQIPAITTIDIPQQDANELHILFLDEPGSFTFTAISEECEKETQEITFEVIAPTGIKFELDYDENGLPRTYHPEDSYTSFVVLKQTLLPLTVNFYNVKTGERNSGPVKETGFYKWTSDKYGSIHCHMFGNVSKGEECFMPLDQDNQNEVHTREPKWNILDNRDWVGTTFDAALIKEFLLHSNTLPKESTSEYHIVTWWVLNREGRQKFDFTTIHQRITLLGDGTVILAKENFSKTFKFNKDLQPDKKRITISKDSPLPFNL